MGRPTNALIVDDEAHVRAFLRLLLREAGIDHAWEATDGSNAIEMTIAHKPELVLLDINLPIMNGLQVLAEIKRISADIPVIMVSSQSAMSTVLEAVRLGASAFVLKHSPRTEALATLREALDAIESGDEGDEAEAS